MLGELVTGTELGLNSRTVDEYLFVGFKTVNLSEVI
jgi:hypothetical protein